MHFVSSSLVALGLAINALSSALPEGPSLESRATKQCTATTGNPTYQSDGMKYWISASAAFESAYKVTVNLLVRDTLAEGTGVKGFYRVEGKGVWIGGEKDAAVVNRSGAGAANQKSELLTWDKPFGSEKRILSVTVYGCNLMDGTSVCESPSWTTRTVRNPYVYGEC